MPRTRSARLAVWARWCSFCDSVGREPSLRDVPSPETRLSYLLVFGLRHRRAQTSRTGKPVRASTVADALLAVGKGIAALGVPDPRKEAPGSERLHPLLADFYGAMERADDASTRAHPANTSVLRRVATDAALAGDRAALHASDLCVVGFYWLLRPGEYLYTRASGRCRAFRLQDVAFVANGRLYPATDASLNDVDAGCLSRASLTFTDQKNAVRGECIGHAATTDPLLCPCKALARICAHLRSFGASPDTPLYTYATDAARRRFATPQLLTLALRRAAAPLRAATGIDPRLLSARSLRPGGATALLCAGVDADVIQLLGRWHSDAMLRYLRAAAAAGPDFAQRMLDAGAFTFAASAAAASLPLPIQAPPDFVAASALHRLT